MTFVQFAAATVIISQVVMIPVAIRVAGSIDKYGYWRCILLALLIIPMILGYTAWSYYVFRGKVKQGEGYH